MIGFIIRILGNGLALFVADRFVPGFVVNGSWKEYLIAGIFLGLLNFLIKPILKLIFTPLIILTLGTFTIVINALLLWLVGYIFKFVVIQDITALVYATILIGVVNIIISAIAKIA